MNIREIAEVIEGEILNSTDKDVKQAYCSDMLSMVMGKCGEESALITYLNHENVIAVASLKEMPLVILCEGRKPDDETLEKAKEEEIAVISSKLQAFEIAGKLYEKGIKGVR